MRCDRWSASHRNYRLIHLAIMDMTEDIPYDNRPVSHIFRVNYYAQDIYTQFNRFIFFNRSRSHVR